MVSQLTIQMDIPVDPTYEGGNQEVKKDPILQLVCTQTIFRISLDSPNVSR